jgi:hypothetical protein
MRSQLVEYYPAKNGVVYEIWKSPTMDGYHAMLNDGTTEIANHPDLATLKKMLNTRGPH